MPTKRNLKRARTGVWLVLFVLQLASCQSEQEVTGRIAFISFRDGNTDIYVIDAGGHNEIQLTSDPNDDYSPTWSPDGEQIAFVSNRNGNRDIYVLSVDGTHLTQLTHSSSQDYRPAWSPDGERIAFISDRNGSDEVCLMNADGTDKDCCPASNPNPLSFNELAWSPDSKHLAYTSVHDIEDCEPSQFGSSCSYNAVSIIDADTMEQIQLTDLAFNKTAASPTWSSTGHWRKRPLTA